MYKKLTAIVLIFVFCGSVWLMPLAEAADIGAVRDAKNNTITYFQNTKPVLDSWGEMVALYAASENLNSGFYVLPEWDSEMLRVGGKETDYANFILGALAKNVNPRSLWEGRDIVAELLEKQDVSTGKFGGGAVNDQIWAMIALDAMNETYNIDMAIEWLSGLQLEGGGYALTGSKSDVDMTGMALTALSRHRGNALADKLITDAVECLHNMQLENGSFSSWGRENSNSIACAIEGLCAVGENVLSEKWLKNGVSMVDALIEYQQPDGSFAYRLNPMSSNPLATYQSFIALCDVLAGNSVYSRFTVPQNDGTTGNDVNTESGNTQYSYGTMRYFDESSNNTDSLQENEAETSVEGETVIILQIPIGPVQNTARTQLFTYLKKTLKYIHLGASYANKG